MRLEGNRVYLIPLSTKELNGNYVNWLNDKEVCKYNSHGDVEYTHEDALTYIKNLSDDISKMVYAVYTILNNVHIGNISLQRIDRKNNNAEIALLFGETSYWNKGYATEALKLLIEKARKMMLHRLYFGTHVENIAMQKVGEKLGFQKEGEFNDSILKNGVYYDASVYGLLIDQ
jgi:RimJ/RimL family protein N-acetyltransferase